MTAETKAIELINKFAKSEPYLSYTGACKCSLIAVDEIINTIEPMHKPEYASFDCIGGRKLTFKSESNECLNGYELIEYYKTVKEEINKL